jgi:CubicO group peptidase (beta-lactamase class C family)
MMKPRLIPLAVAAAALVSLAAPPGAAQRPRPRTVAPAEPAIQAGPLGGLDAYIENALRRWEIPGLAIAVVKDDSVVYARGFGVRELGRAERVDENTLFAVGSTTKAFTAALVGMLVDSNRVRWEDPVTRHLPWFQLYDPYVTREMTLRDLLCHRSGLTRADGLWYASGLSRDEIVRRMRFHRPRWSFRSRYGYQNIMFLAAGQAVAAVTGRSWDQVIRERLLVPLGMTRTTTSTSSLAGMDNVATPHARIQGQVRTVAWRNLDNAGPAGSINSSVRDMAQWVRLNLAGGVYAGRRLLSQAVVREMQSPQMVIGSSQRVDSIYPEIHMRAYGLGWVINDYRGRKVVSHGGAIDGMRAQVGLLPEERLGVVVLANGSDASTLNVALMYRVFDAFTGGVRRDWSADLLADLRWNRQRADSISRARDSARVRGTEPSASLGAYTGRWLDSLYGEAAITEENGGLVARYGSLIGDLEHWHYNVFRVVWRDPIVGRSFVSFDMDLRGRPHRVTIRDDEEDLDPMVFERAAEPPGPGRAAGR